MAVKLKEQQSAELNYKEMELQGKTIVVSLQQTKKELIKANGLLLAEREESSRKTATINQQKELYKKLKSDTSEQLNRMGKRLQMEGLHRGAYEVQV